MQTWGFSFNLGTKVASRWSMYHCTTFMHRKWCKFTNIHNTNMMHAFVNSCMQKRRLNWLYLWSRWYYLGITKHKSLLKILNIDFLLSSQTSDECFSLFMFTVLLPMYTYCLFFFHIWTSCDVSRPLLFTTFLFTPLAVKAIVALRCHRKIEHL